MLTPREEIAAAAEKLLTPFLRPAGKLEYVAMTKAFEPAAEDYPRVFVADIVERARERFAKIWTVPEPPLPRAGQTQVEVFVAYPEEMLAPESPFGQAFPGGYAQIAHLLLPNPWVAWRYTVSGQSQGMAYNGLVQLDDRFVWFPKPWRFLAEP